MLKNYTWDDGCGGPLPGNIENVKHNKDRDHLENDSTIAVFERKESIELSMQPSVDTTCPSDFPMSFIDRLPSEVTLQCIWPKIIAQHETFKEKCVAIWSFRAVCTSWRTWAESTREYADYRESYVDYLCYEDSRKEFRGYCNLNRASVHMPR